MALFTEIQERNDHSRNENGEIKRIVRLMEEKRGRTSRLATRTFVLNRYTKRILRIVGSDGPYRVHREFDRFGRVGDRFNEPSSRTRTHSDNSVAVGVVAGAVLGGILAGLGDD